MLSMLILSGAIVVLGLCKKMFFSGRGLGESQKKHLRVGFHDVLYFEII